MALIKSIASKLSFAHLGVIGARSASTDEEPEDDNKPKSRRADKGEEGEPIAEGDDDDTEATGASAEGDDENTEDNDGEPPKKAKKAKAGKDKSGKGGDEDDDDSDEEMHGNSAAAQARSRERARCAAIFASPAAARHPVTAAHFAFQTTMSRAAAVAALEALPAAAAPRAAHPARAAQNPNVTPNAAPEKSAGQRNADLWAQAHARNNRSRLSAPGDQTRR
jgi:hypothetical protein